MAQEAKRRDYGFETVAELCRYVLTGATNLKDALDEARRILYEDAKLYNRLVDQLVDEGLRHYFMLMVSGNAKKALTVTPVVDDQDHGFHDSHSTRVPSSTLPKGVSGETLAKSHEDGGLICMSEPLLNSWFGGKMLRDLYPTELRALAATNKSRAKTYQLKSRFFEKLLKAYRAKEPKSRKKKIGEVLSEHDCQKAKKEAGLV